jgi:HK97 family phage major capsid protein
VVLNPEDLEKIERLKKNNEVNAYLKNPWDAVTQPVLYGMPVIETSAITLGTGLVGDFTRAILFDRESVAISLGTAGDDFIRNIVRVLGELRAGFVVARPAAFCELTIP